MTSMAERRWTRRIDGSAVPDKASIGGKAWSLAQMRGLGLDVPPAFVVTTQTCLAYLATNDFPAGLVDEIDAGLAGWRRRPGAHSAAGVLYCFPSVRARRFRCRA